MEEEIYTPDKEINEISYQKISTTELIERFKAAKKERIRTCNLNRLIFELDESDSYDFKSLLLAAGVIDYIHSQNRVTINLIFENCIFKSKLNFDNLTFDEYSGLSFSDCKYENELSIEECRIDKLIIENSNKPNSKNNDALRGSIYVKKCSIENNLSILSTRLEILSLSSNELKRLNISNCKNMYMLFVHENMIKNKFVLSGCITKYFIYAIRNEQNCIVRILDCRFNEKIEISNGLIDNNFTFKNSFLKNFSFKNAILDRARLISCKFEDYILYDEQLLFNKEAKKRVLVEEISENRRKDMEENYSLVLYQYKALESNFDYYKNYEEAGKFHKRQFEVQRQFSKKFEIKKYILWMYNLFSGYGESYVKSIASFFTILIVFSGLYLFTGLDYVNKANSIDEKVNTISTIYYCDSNKMYNPFNDIGVSLLYSLSNTLPIRKDIENIKPANDWTRFFSYIEITFQSIILTLFIIALRRKFKR